MPLLPRRSAVFFPFLFLSSALGSSWKQSLRGRWVWTPRVRADHPPHPDPILAPGTGLNPLLEGLDASYGEFRNSSSQTAVGFSCPGSSHRPTESARCSPQRSGDAADTFGCQNPQLRSPELCRSVALLAVGPVISAGNHKL